MRSWIAIGACVANLLLIGCVLWRSPIEHFAKVISRLQNWMTVAVGRTRDRTLQEVQEGLASVHFLEDCLLGLEAGLSAQSAFERSSALLDPASPMRELKDLCRAVSRGERFQDALSRYRGDTRAGPLAEIAEAYGVSIQLGTELRTALSDVVRSQQERALTQLGVRASQAAVKMLFPAVLFVLPALLVLLGAPLLSGAYDAIAP